MTPQIPHMATDSTVPMPRAPVLPPDRTETLAGRLGRVGLFDEPLSDRRLGTQRRWRTVCVIMVGDERPASQPTAWSPVPRSSTLEAAR
jgi:hypothetical protein